MTIERIRKSLRPIAVRIYQVPFVGYGARLIVALIKLPRINFHLHRIDGEVRHLLEAKKAPLENTPIPDGGLHARLQELDSSWRHNLPLFLNAVSSVGAFGHKLAAIERSLEAEGRFMRAEIAQLMQIARADAEFQSIRDEIAQIRQDLLKAAEGDGPIAQGAPSSNREVELSNAIAENVMSINRLWERIELIRREFAYHAADFTVEGTAPYGEKNNVRSTEVE
jgi:hypothetical protein